VVTWILDTVSPELQKFVRELTETPCQAWLAIEAQFLGNSKSSVLQLNARFAPLSKETSASATTIVG
jgi:hypothetical protein